MDKILTEDILRIAEETNDLELLKLLDRTTNGSANPLSINPDIRDARNVVEKRIQGNLASIETDIASARDDTDKARKTQLQGSIVRALAADPTAEVPEEVLLELEERLGDPTIRAKVADWRKKFSEASRRDDPEVIVELLRDIRRGTVIEQDIISLIAVGVISSPSTVTMLLDRADAQRQRRATGGGIWMSSTAKRYQKRIGELLGASKPDIFGNRAYSDDALRALDEYQERLEDWEDRNPNASAKDRREIALEIGRSIIKNIIPAEYGPGGVVMKPGVYGPSPEK